MKTLRLCFVGPGASITLRRWARWFAERGHQTTIVTVEPADRGSLQGLHQVDISAQCAVRKIGRLLSVVRLRHVLRHIDPDVVHVHYVRGLAWGMAFDTAYPFVATPWGSDVLDEQGAYREWYSKGLTRRVLDSARLVTAHSAYMATRIRQLVPHVRHLMRVGWGVDLRLFRPGLDHAALRQRWNIGQDHRVLFSPRLAQPFYNHHRIIQVLPAVCKVFPKTTLVISEQFADAAYVEQLQRSVHELDLEAHVRFVGAIPYEDMPLWFNLAEVAVMLPSSDGMPNSLLEAMACGAVPVLQRLPQYEELICHEENGWLVDGTEESLTNALITALRSEPWRQAMARRNRGIVESIADQSREMSVMERLYYQVLGIPRSVR